MEKTVTGLLIVILSLSFTATFATPFEFQNKELTASLADGSQIHLQFTDEIYPIIDNGYIIGTTGFSLIDTPFRASQNSFLITMPEQGWFVVGNRIKDNNYSIKLNEWNGATFLKTEFKASLNDIKLEQPSIETPAEPIVSTAPQKELIVLVEQDLRNYWKDNYDIDVKVFDKKLNPNPKFLDTWGAVNGATIKVTLTPQDGSTHDIISGQTSKIGLWNGDYVIPDNKKIGKYLVNVEVDYQESKTMQNLEMFIFGLGQTGATPES